MTPVTTAKVTLPAGLDPGSVLRLQRLSGRPVPFYLDAIKSMGPLFYITPSMLGSNFLWADENLYRLSVTDPTGATSFTEVQVGVGQTAPPVPDLGDLVTFTDLEALLATERTYSDGAYLRAAGAETISGAWDFMVAPTVNGDPIGTGGGGGVTPTDLATAITAEVSRADGKYPARTAAATISGAWDFTGGLTIGGQPIVTGSLAGYALVSYVDAQIASLEIQPAQAQNAAGELWPLMFIEPGQTAPAPPPLGKRYDIELVEAVPA